MAEDIKAYEKALQKANDEGYEALSDEELNLLKYHNTYQGKLVNSDDYSPMQIEDIKDREKSGGNVTDEEKAALVGKKVDKQKKLLDVVIHGTNDIFRKNYDFKEDGVSFDIAIRMPNIVEEGRIVARQNTYLQGTASYQNDYINTVFYGLALIRECGIEIPVQLQDDDKLYAGAMKWLYKIATDFLGWESRFRY